MNLRVNKVALKTSSTGSWETSDDGIHLCLYCCPTLHHRHRLRLQIGSHHFCLFPVSPLPSLLSLSRLPSPFSLTQTKRKQNLSLYLSLWIYLSLCLSVSLTLSLALCLKEKKKAALSLVGCSICSSVSRFKKETPSVSGASCGGALGNAHKFWEVQKLGLIKSCWV